MKIVPGVWKQTVNGSPVKPFLQEQIGLCLMTLQFEFLPQEPGQGSWHFWFKQARLREQSELVTHSGRHAGGLPMKIGRQEQTAWLLLTRHWLLGPQGDGLQTSLGVSTKMIDVSFKFLKYWRRKDYLKYSFTKILRYNYIHILKLN